MATQGPGTVPPETGRAPAIGEIRDCGAVGRAARKANPGEHFAARTAAGSPSSVELHPGAFGSAEHCIRDLELAVLEGRVRARLERCVARARALGDLDGRIRANAGRLAETRSPWLRLLGPARQDRRRRRLERRHAELVTGRRRIGRLIHARELAQWLHVLVAAGSTWSATRWAAQTQELRHLVYQLLEILAMQQVLDGEALVVRVLAGQGACGSERAGIRAEELLSELLDERNSNRGGPSSPRAGEAAERRAFLLRDYRDRLSGPQDFRRCA